MPVTINGTTGITTPGVTNSGNETVSGTLAVTGAVTGSGLSTTLYPLVSGTAVASTSGTSIDFTGIPSWVKRITVMYNGVSTNGTSNYQIQIGSGSFTTSGYSSGCAYMGGTGATTTGNFITSGFFIVLAPAASSAHSGIVTIANVSGNNWVYSSNLYYGNSSIYLITGAGNSPTLSGLLDRVRITTVNGTDTFDAGSINILYE